MRVVSDVISIVTSFALTLLTTLVTILCRHACRNIFINMEKNQHCGCFAWLVSVKRSCNTRWAKFRNNFRRRFYRDNRPELRVDPHDINSETGTTTIITKIPYNKRSSPVRQDAHHVHADVDNEIDDILVSRFVSDIINVSKTALEADIKNRNIITDEAHVNDSITSSIISQIAETAVVESLTCLVNDKTTLETDTQNKHIITEQDDNVSMTSSVISQLAETAVVESLTCLTQDSNESATRTTVPKTLSEFMGYHGIADIATETDGMSPVSD